MKVSTQTSKCESVFGAAEAVRLLCEVGFDAIDYTMCGERCALLCDDLNPKEVIRELLSITKGYGKTFNQTHTPFPPYRIGDEEYNVRTGELVKRAIGYTAELGAKITIVHPIAFRAPEREIIERNMEALDPFFKEAKRSGVKIAIENMWGTHPDNARRIIPNVCSTGDTHRRFVDAFTEVYGDTVCSCLDVGHSGLVGDSADSAARALGDTLLALHVHDNDFFNDTHTAPFFGKINFDKLTDALAEINYKGDFTFESDAVMLRMPKELYRHILKFLLETGRYFTAEIERKRNLLGGV